MSCFACLAIADRQP
jgi:hypothetical protein